jgi:hypothetical protein
MYGFAWLYEIENCGNQFECFFKDEVRRVGESIGIDAEIIDILPGPWLSPEKR